MVEGGDQSARNAEHEDSTTYQDVGLASHPEPAVIAGAQPSGGAGVDKDPGGILDTLSLPRKLPSIVDIKAALPPHVFERNAMTSLYYAFKDFAQVILLFLLAEWVWSSSLLPTWGLLVLLPGYWLLQGTFFTSIFVAGHDAGHSSFSRHDLLNDVVGNILHTFLLCPYYCWKLSHRHHHKNTGNIDKDEVFYPVRNRDNNGGSLLPYFGLGVGWFGYLLKGYKPRAVSHINPFDPIFSRHIPACILSLTLIIGWVAVLWQYALSAGFWKLFVHYIVPDFIFASYTVIITFLHHTEDDIPWYDDSLWEYVRGQLSSVDRHYGWCHNIIHNIGTHQIHHLFSMVPHYHLEEATRVFRKKFPELVQVRSERILPAFVRMFRKYLKQHTIPDSTLVHLYK